MSTISSTTSGAAASIGNSSGVIDRVIERSLRLREVEQFLSTTTTTTTTTTATTEMMVSSPDKYLPLKRRRDTTGSSVASGSSSVGSNATTSVYSSNNPYQHFQTEEEGLLAISKFHIQHEFQNITNTTSITATTMKQRLRRVILDEPKKHNHNHNNNNNNNNIKPKKDDHRHYQHSTKLDIQTTLSTSSLTLNASILEMDEEEEEEEDEDDIFNDLPATPQKQSQKNNNNKDNKQKNNNNTKKGKEITTTTPKPQITSSSSTSNTPSSSSSSASFSCFTAPSPLTAAKNANIHTNSAATNITNACTSLSRLTRQVVANNRGAPVAPPRTYNRVQVHVYDLIHRETILETPWCDFPIGQCFNTLNDGMHCLGTGAYHVGIEVNGLEYAFGSNPVEGQSGVFVCPPKQSPGYQYRTTLDFGQLETTRRQWILVPVKVSTNTTTTSTIESPSDASPHHQKSTLFLHQQLHPEINNTNTTSSPTTATTADYYYNSFDESFDDAESLHAKSETCLSPTTNTTISTRKRWKTQQHNPTTTAVQISQQQQNQQGHVAYQYREVKSFVDGKIILKEMAKEYMGLDYDILRKNCCTFVKDACLRLGATEDQIPTWFLNLAQTGVITEDAVNTVDGYVFSPIRRILLEQCSEEDKFKVIVADASTSSNTNCQDIVAPGGFEIIALSSPMATGSSSGGGGGYRSVHVEEVTQQRDFSPSMDGSVIGIRTTVSWAY